MKWTVCIIGVPARHQSYYLQPDVGLDIMSDEGAAGCFIMARRGSRFLMIIADNGGSETFAERSTRATRETWHRVQTPSFVTMSVEQRHRAESHNESGREENSPD